MSFPLFIRSPKRKKIMKLHFKLVWVLLVFFPGMLEAQNTLDSFLKSVRGNDPSLNAARKEHEAETRIRKNGFIPGETRKSNTAISTVLFRDRKPNGFQHYPDL